jgi:3-(3-hydroxy-phenyl)propionate hydroxylase
VGLPGGYRSSPADHYRHSIESKGCPQIESISIIIVGAGPTGLAAGNLLGATGIPALVIERNAAVSDIPKAIALDDEGLRICQAMGLSSALSDCILSDLSIECVGQVAGKSLGDSSRDEGWRVSEERLLAKVVPASRRNGYPLISTFYQPEFEAALLDGLRRFPCVEVRFQHTVEALEQSAEGIIVSIRTPAGALRQVQCAYLLACDGGSSSVRHLLNISMRGTTFAQQWLVIDSISGVTPAPVVKIFCNPQRPAVAIPAPHNRRRWEFMLLPGETEKDMLEPATISALLQLYAFPQNRRRDAIHRVLVPGRAWPPGRDESRPYDGFQTQIIRQAVYTFHAAQARTFSQGRVFLLGDAAHMMPPFGGQGLNSGLRDAHNLAWKVAMALQGRAAPQLLATYHTERSRHAARMGVFASLLGKLFMTTARPLAYCRNLLIQLLFALPATRAYLVELRIKPQAKYRAGFFFWEATGCRKSMVGSFLPQPEVITQQGQHTLLDEVLGAGFALLRRHPNPGEAFASVRTDFWEKLGARFVCIQTGDAPRSSTNSHPHQHSAPQQQSEPRRSQALPIVVVRSMDKDFLRKSQDCFVVVRPDRFILGVFKEEKADAFVSAFQRLLLREDGNIS